MMRTVAITGLSGVGKTTFLTALKKRITFQHLQAGSLIKAARELKCPGDVVRDDLKILDLNENQMLLVATFHRSRDPSGLVILDGHTLIEREDGLTPIPANVFAALKIDTIFALVERPEIIAARRAGDLTRKRPELPIQEIGHRQEVAVDQAKAIAAELRVPFRRIRSADEAQCHRLLSSPDWSDGL